MGQSSNTRITLLGRMRTAPTDAGAWSEFVEWYGRKIYVWCRNWGLGQGGPPHPQPLSPGVTGARGEPPFSGE
jgi:hypothetical protein